MPPDEKVLSREEKDRILKWLESKWTSAKQCPICGTNKWHIGDHLSTILTTHKGNIFIGGPTIPVIIVVCMTCGYTLLFNAVVVGIPSVAKEGSSNAE